MAIGYLVLTFLILFSSFFSGMEIAFFSLSELDLVEIENSKSRNRNILLGLLKDREKLLTTILVGNNVINIIASSLVGIFSVHIANTSNYSIQAVAGLFTGILTVVILFFGEIFPKNIAINHNKSLALFFSPAMLSLSTGLLPITFIFHRLSLLINRIFLPKNTGVSITESTVINVVKKGKELGVINQTETDLIQNVFVFDQREVSSIMTPRTSVFVLHDSSTIGEVLELLLEKGYSRIPIYSNVVDNITGIIIFKQILKELILGNKQVKLKALATKPKFVYETASISSLLDQFRQERTHLAVIVDEFGGMSGIVTLEDILEELVGEIFDETDVFFDAIKNIGPNKWLVQGRLDLITLNRKIQSTITIDEQYDTIQGLVMTQLNRVPRIGDKIEIENYRFTVMKMNKNEIQMVLIEKQTTFN